ncbi:MAG: FMN-binding negative transcriptional regulator [Pseudomonadota bacterium]
MYIPPNMGIAERSECEAFIASNSFAVLTSSDLQVTHLPLVLSEDCTRLRGHFARANRHWRQLEEQRVVAVFSGPHAYISPSWYADSPAVPTWNYAAVHVYGTVKLTSDEMLAETLDQMLQHFEPALLETRDIVTPDYQAKLQRAIIGFEIDIESIEGKQKLGQLRSGGDQRGVSKALASSDRLDDRMLNEYMKQTGLGLGNNEEKLK